MLAMAATKPLEPIPKLAKLEVPVSNGATHHTPKLLVKKLSPNAITPSRSSTLAAEGTYARLAPRSGLAWKHSIDVGAGVIDADYRGPVGVVLFNLSDQDFIIKAGDRVAQLILERIVTPEVMEVDDLEIIVRGEGGFGSTGIATVVLPSS